MPLVVAVAAYSIWLVWFDLPRWALPPNLATGSRIRRRLIVRLTQALVMGMWLGQVIGAALSGYSP